MSRGSVVIVLCDYCRKPVESLAHVEVQWRLRGNVLVALTLVHHAAWSPDRFRRPLTLVRYGESLPPIGCTYWQHGIACQLSRSGQEMLIPKSGPAKNLRRLAKSSDLGPTLNRILRSLRALAALEVHSAPGRSARPTLGVG